MDAIKNVAVVVDPNAIQISPAINPMKTNESGRYGWKVGQGCWYVVVAADGYQTLTSPMVGVPPAVADLDLTLLPLSTDTGRLKSTFLPVIVK